MASQREGGINPLRPYYVPPGSSPPAAAASAAAAAAAPPSSPLPAAPTAVPSSAAAPYLKTSPAATVSVPASAPRHVSSSSPPSNAARYASRARDMLQDLDYDSYLDAGDESSGPAAAAVRGLRTLADDLLWKYTSVLMAQPFEVAKTVLQVRVAQADIEAAAAAAGVAGAVAEQGKVEEQDEEDQEGEDEALIPMMGKKARAGDRGKERGLEDEDDLEAQGSIYDIESSSQAWNVNQNSGSDDDDDDEHAYFSSAANSAAQASRHRARPPNRGRTWSSATSGLQRRPSGTGTSTSTGPAKGPTTAKTATAKSPSNPQHLRLRRPDSVFDVLGQLWQREGPFGVWKGSNATFIYSVLQTLLENWSRSLMSAIFDVPDLGVVAEADRIVEIAAPYPWASLLVAATAAVATGLALAPLDLVRTRLLLTPTAHPPRRTLTLLRALPSHLCTPSLLIPTALHSLVHPLLTLSTPLAMRTTRLAAMDGHQLSPMAFSLVRFCASSACLLVKLPLETVLRRGQVQALLRQEPSLETVVPVGSYSGVFGTMYDIITEEGTREVVVRAGLGAAKKGAKPGAGVGRPGAAGVAGSAGGAKARHHPGARPAAATVVNTTTYLKGQGLEGLWRGWKVSWWGLVGLWISGVVGNGGEGEF